MFDTTITVIGNVLTAPEWRRTKNTNTLVLHFKVASTSRRLDKESGQWVDGTNLRVRVTCWRRLAENVAVSIALGDPVIVHGRLFTRDWSDDQGQRHLAYELEADAVGHDLARGVSRYARRRSGISTDVVEGPEAEALVAGQPSDPTAAPPVSDDLAACQDILEEFDSAVFEVPSQERGAPVDPAFVPVTQACA